MKSHLGFNNLTTCNRTHLIGETLDIVLAQTYTDWNCVLEADGSLVAKNCQFLLRKKSIIHLIGEEKKRKNIIATNFTLVKLFIND